MNEPHAPAADPFAGRRVTLSTGQDGLRVALSVSCKVGPEPDLLTMRASDDTVDRYGEVIDASGWQLDHYQRNPVVQADHDYRVAMTVARAERTWVDGGALLQVWRFAAEANPMARLVRDMYAGGFLHASSVGFLPIEGLRGGPKDPWRYKHTKQELLEVSAVSIPANPTALTNALRQGAVTGGQLRDLTDWLRSFDLPSSKTSPPATPPAPGGGTPAAPAWWEQSLRTLSEVMRKA